MASEFPNALRYTDPAARPLARVEVTPEQLLYLFASGGRYRPAVAGLPEDAEFYSINYDFCTQTICVAVSHPSFPPVPPGTMIPLLPLEVRLVPADDAGDDDYRGRAASLPGAGVPPDPEGIDAAGTG